MPGRRHRNGLCIITAQDPGKDLFAYLFLMIMVFSFMLLMTTEEKRAGMKNQKAPQQHLAGQHAGLTRVEAEKIGRLVRKKNTLYLSFEKTLYNPATDLARMAADERISINQNTTGKNKKTIYIVEEKNNQVFLSEYLNAFQHLNRQGISVAFAKQLN